VEVTLESAQAWKDFRAERDAERFLQEWRPSRVAAQYRVEQKWLDDGCVSVPELVDVGRGIFLRTFTLAEGLGNDLAQVPGTDAGPLRRPNFRRLQRGHFGGPDAVACVNCHWKGGFAGSGDRADNAFLFGDGSRFSTHDARNPPALWGAGWAELIAKEMSEDLGRLRDAARAEAIVEDATVEVRLESKGTDFGVLVLRPDGQGGAIVDTGQVFGVDDDLIVKPFGWKGTFTTLRQFIGPSLQFHLNMQAEELVDGSLSTPYPISLGEGPPSDPDADGVEREVTEGQVTALTLFIATLDVPIVHVPSEGPLLGPPHMVSFGGVDGQEYVDRWFAGVALFQEIGCSSCHTPLMSVRNSRYSTTATLSGSRVEIDLATESALPGPSEGEDGEWLVPVFSDFKRHEMGDLLRARSEEAGVQPGVYLTRRLWGVANTRPWLHDASAVSFDEAIAMHGGEGSEARGVAMTFAELPEGQKASLRMFLLSLRRAPAVRVR
jgi:hypothetical protein